MVFRVPGRSKEHAALTTIASILPKRTISKNASRHSLIPARLVQERDLSRTPEPTMKTPNSRHFRHTLLTLFAGCSLLACGSGPGDSTGSTCPTDSTLTYTNFGQAFMQSHCLSCHRSGGPASPTLSTLEQI